MIYSSQNSVYRLGYDGIIQKKYNLQGRLLESTFSNDKLVLIGDRYVFIEEKNKKETFVLKNRISAGASTKNQFVFGFDDGRIEFWDNDLESILVVDTFSHTSSISNIIVQEDLFYTMSKNKILVQSLKSEYQKEFNLKRPIYSYVKKENYIYGHSFGGEVYRLNLNNQILEEITYFKSLDSADTLNLSKSISGKLKSINYRGDIIKSFQPNNQVVDFDVSFEDNMWIIGSERGEIYFTKGLGEVLKKYSFDYYKNLSTVQINSSENLFMLGSHRGIGGVYYIKDKKTIIEIGKGFSNFKSGNFSFNDNVFSPMWVSNSSIHQSTLFHIPFSLNKKKRKKENDIELINPGHDTYSLINNSVSYSVYYKRNNVLIFSSENKVYEYSLNDNISTIILERDNKITALYIKNESLIIGFDTGELDRFSLEHNKVEKKFKLPFPSPISSISSSLNGDTIFFSNSEGVFETNFLTYKRLLKERNISKIINNPKTQEVGVLQMVGIDSTSSSNDINVSLNQEYQKIKEIFLTENNGIIVLTYSGRLIYVNNDMEFKSVQVR